jgi:hypothetical protein
MKAAMLPSRRLLVRHNSIEHRTQQHPTDSPDCNVVLYVPEGLLSGRHMSRTEAPKKVQFEMAAKKPYVQYPAIRFIFGVF